MTGKDLIEMGFPQGRAVGVALRLIPKAKKALGPEGVERELRAVLANPVQNAAHEYFEELATALREEQEKPVSVERAAPAPYRIWGDHACSRGRSPCRPFRRRRSGVAREPPSCTRGRRHRGCRRGTA